MKLFRKISALVMDVVLPLSLRSSDWAVDCHAGNAEVSAPILRKNLAELLKK